MELLILHLSDIHFQDENNYSQDNITGITNALRPSIGQIEHILVVISGDLSFSGSKIQFIDIRKFLNKLKDQIKKEYKVKDIIFAIVPGNHDVDYSSSESYLSREDLERIEKEFSYSSYIDIEIDKQKQFYACSRMFNCFPQKSLLHQLFLNYGEKKIQINLINTAIFSSKDEDQGFHYLPDHELEKLGEQNDADFVFTIMHHPHSWFSWRITDRLEKVIYEKSDLIFVGHKHYESTRTIIDPQTSVNILAGGMLSNRGNWDDSEFHICILDLDNRNIQIRKYQWEKAEKVYIPNDNIIKRLSKDRNNPLGISVRNEYLSEHIYQDPFMIANSYLDYFEFPFLSEQRDEKKDGISKDIDNMTSFLQRLETSKKILVSGSNDSGKTILAKAVFCELLPQKTVILINGSDVGKNPERTLRNAFEEIYGHDPAKYELFRQSSPNSLVLIIDDVDAINDLYKDVFIDHINNIFRVILETCQQEIELDIESRLRKKHDRKDYVIFRLEPFYITKRRKLVTKVVNIIGKDGQNREKMIDVLCDSLSRQKSLYNWSPSFIVQFTKYYYNNIGESSQKDGNVFSKVFENNLISLIKPFVGKNFTIDKVLIILDKIAYSIYKNKEYPITVARVCEIIENYNEKYDETVNTVTLLQILVNSKIMKQCDHGYLFYERSYLAYFTAREIRRLINAGEYTDIRHVMEYSYMNINADILLFVTFITDNIEIIRLLMDVAEEITQEWDEFSLTPINVPYMSEPAHIIINSVQEGDREREEQKKLEAEKETAKSISIANDSSIFDGESEDLDFLQKLLRSTSIMTTLSRALPSFEHMMERADKERCVKLIYLMPLRIFYIWAKEVDGVSSDLIKMIKEFHEWEYRKDKPELETLSDDQALDILRLESSSLLLDLMNAPFSYATKENTWRYIDRFDYNFASTYGIEHLMGLKYVDDVDSFISEAIKLFGTEKGPLAIIMIQRVVRNFMVTSRSIEYNDVQKLNARIFSNRLKSSQLIIEQDKNRIKN